MAALREAERTTIIKSATIMEEDRPLGRASPSKRQNPAKHAPKAAAIPTVLALKLSVPRESLKANRPSAEAILSIKRIGAIVMHTSNRGILLESHLNMYTKHTMQTAFTRTVEAISLALSLSNAHIVDAATKATKRSCHSSNLVGAYRFRFSSVIAPHTRKTRAS